jgi:hypothetical protein
VASRLTPVYVVLSMAASVVPSPGTPLARLGDKVIREADFQGYLSRAHPEQIAEIRRSRPARQSALDEYLDLLAMVAKARRAGIDQELRFKKALELMEMKVLSQLVTERHRGRLLVVSRVPPEEVKAHYVRHQAEFTEEPRFTAHHLLVYVKGNPAFPEKGLAEAEAQARAERALAALRAGESWEAVARTYSDEVPTNQHAGSSGTVSLATSRPRLSGRCGRRRSAGRARSSGPPSATTSSRWWSGSRRGRPSRSTRSRGCSRTASLKRSPRRRDRPSWRPSPRRRVSSGQRPGSATRSSWTRRP